MPHDFRVVGSPPDESPLEKSSPPKTPAENILSCTLSSFAGWKQYGSMLFQEGGSSVRAAPVYNFEKKWTSTFDDANYLTP